MACGRTLEGHRAREQRGPGLPASLRPVRGSPGRASAVVLRTAAAGPGQPCGRSPASGRGADSRSSGVPLLWRGEGTVFTAAAAAPPGRSNQNFQRSVAGSAEALCPLLAAAALPRGPRPRVARCRRRSPEAPRLGAFLVKCRRLSSRAPFPRVLCRPEGERRRRHSCAEGVCHPFLSYWCFWFP